MKWFLRILTSMYSVGLMQNNQTGNLSNNVLSRDHDFMSYEFAIAGTVLLKNNGILPLPQMTNKKIVVLGDDGHKKPNYAGRGSGAVIAPYVITPLQGVEKVLGKNISYASTMPIANAVALAQAADIAIVCVGLTSAEGTDRPDLYLGSNQDQLVEAIAKVQPNTIVVVHSPGAVLMPWLDSVAAVVCGFMPGQEDGDAMAAILFGYSNPAGKLPVTFPASMSDLPFTSDKQYPGVDNEVYYSEHLLMGYRWYDAHNVTPMFPFGHGLSYTTFQYNDLAIDGSIDTNFTVGFSLTNSGKRDGAEVAQLYLGLQGVSSEPPKKLRGFSKLFLNHGESQSIEFTLSSKDFSIWNPDSDEWEVVSGDYNVFIGSSSRDIRLEGTITVS